MAQEELGQKDIWRTLLGLSSLDIDSKSSWDHSQFYQSLYLLENRKTRDSFKPHNSATVAKGI